MASPPAYRIAEPIIASSSPSHAGLDSSPPPPPSTPPPRSSPLGGFDDDSPSFLVARSPPPNDPYSAHNNATPSQHPSFGKQYPHVKHPSAKRTTKRSLPVSPNLPQGTSTVAGPSSRPVSSSSRRTAGDRRAGVSSSSNGYGSSSSSDAQGSTASRRHRNQVLGNFFSADSSEADAPTSDDQLEIVPWSQPGSDADETSTAGVGLGLGSSFQEQGSPTSSRRRLPGASSLQRQPISRSSSVTDPFGAYQASPSSGMRDPRPPLYQNGSSASSPRQPRPQRRRLTGTSPRSRRGASNDDSSDDEGINALLKRDKEPSHLLQEKKMSDFWHNLVEKVYESDKNTRIDAADQQITSIHPVVADLANYVAIEPPRSFEPTSSTSSLPLPASSTSSAAFSRHSTATTRAPFGRTTTSTADSPLTGTPIEAPTARGSSRGKLQLFLNGNQLTRLPSALFEVGNLRVLSLWKNGLTELPPAIGDLQNLRELNVASNQLKWLPAEMLKLRLDRFHHFPNAFVKPTSAGAAEVKMETRAVLSITGALLANQAEEDEAYEAEDAQEDVDAMEADFLASQPTILTPLAPASPGRGLMGPPPLPVRGGAGLVAGPSNAGLAAPRRTFDRTRSDAQVADLLSRGGGNMVNRGAGSSSSSSSSSGATALPPVPPSPPQQDADGDDAMLGDNEQSAPRQAPPTSSISGAAQRSRVLGSIEYIKHIDRLGPLPLPSLCELTIRRLLSPYEDEPEEGDDSIATVVGPGASSSTSPRSPAGRQVVWSRVPSSSSAYQYKYSNGRRPTSVLEHYEPGALRELRAQMQRPTIAALEAARRTMEGKWGSRSGITGLGGVTTRSADSWCSGVAGKEVRDGGEEEDGDEADASSPSSSEGEAPRASRTRSTSNTGGPSGVMDVSNELDTQGDDASLNPYFNRCPNPRHAQTHALSSQAGGGSHAQDGLVDYPLSPAASHFAPIFGAAMERRLEWVSHIGGVKVATANATTTAVDEMGLIPVMWRGCKRGCLSFLEDAM